MKDSGENLEYENLNWKTSQQKRISF